MKQTKEEMIAVLQASIDGEEMQGRLHDRGKDEKFMGVYGDPSWDFFNVEFRAKPKKKQCWVAFSSDNSIYHATTDKNLKLTYHTYIHMTEQL